MLFFIIVAVIFVLVSVYFYFRAERLQNELAQLKRDTKQIKKDYKNLTDEMALVAARQEEFYQQRYKKLVEIAEKRGATQKADLELISPLFSNYASIFRACLIQNGQLKVVAEKCFEGYNKGSYKSFLRYISGQDKQIQRMWSSNNLNGFMSLVEALLSSNQKSLQTKVAKAQPA